MSESTESTEQGLALSLEAEALLRSPDHDRDLYDVNARITAVTRPTEHLLRFTCHLPQGTGDPEWGAPNVTIRMELGPRYDNASRVYTVRAVDREADTLDVDVVLHGHTSPMMRWAAEVARGDALHFRGPRRHVVIPASPERPVAIFADATAIPALVSILEQWPGNPGGVGWVETADREAFAELPEVPGVRLTRVEPGQGSLVDQARGLERPGDVVVWGAGERDVMRALRRYFRNEVGLAKEQVALFGYWKRGTTNTEIDRRRLENYARLVREGGHLEDVDDLSIEV